MTHPSDNLCNNLFSLIMYPGLLVSLNSKEKQDSHLSTFNNKQNLHIVCLGHIHLSRYPAAKTDMSFSGLICITLRLIQTESTIWSKDKLFECTYSFDGSNVKKNARALCN